MDIGTRPRSATSISPGWRIGWTAWTRGRSWAKAGRDHELQEHPGPRMDPPQLSRPGKAGLWPLLCWLADASGGSGYRAWNIQSHRRERAMALPPPVVQGGSLHGATETLEDASEEAQGEVWPALMTAYRLA